MRKLNKYPWPPLLHATGRIELVGRLCIPMVVYITVLFSSSPREIVNGAIPGEMAREEGAAGISSTQAPCRFVNPF